MPIFTWCKSAATCLRWSLSRGFFCPEDGDDNFLRNVGSHKIYTATHPRRRHSSLCGYYEVFIKDQYAWIIVFSNVRDKGQIVIREKNNSWINEVKRSAGILTCGDILLQRPLLFLSNTIVQHRSKATC
jgi:hypothetical protein